MAPFWNASVRENTLKTGLLEALHNLSEQASPEGSWRIKALIDDVREKTAGPWVVDEIRSLRPWLTPRPVSADRDGADAIGALIQALQASQRDDPDLNAAVELLARSAPKELDPASARRVARSARELKRFAQRRGDEGRAQKAFVQEQLQNSLDAIERSQRRLLRTLEDQDGEKAMILRDLEEARTHLQGLREVSVETLADDEDHLLTLVG